MMTKRTPRQAVSFWLNPNFFGLKSLETFLGKTKLSSTYRYLILENFVLSNLDCIINDELSLNPIEVYDTIREEFGKNFHEQEILTAVLHTMMYSACIARQKTEEEHNRKFNELAAQVQQVINSLEHSATP